jgi:hypothetical protein
MLKLQQTQLGISYYRNMTELLNEFHAAKCSDGRDRVYSLNSLSNRPWPVDYHPYVEQVHFELATHQIRRCPTPFLACAGTFRSKNDTLPTWTPNWRVVPASKPFSVNDEWAFKTVDQNVKIYTDGLRIRIKAMEIGTVRDCHETLEGPGRFDIQGPKITPMPTVANFFGFYKIRASEFSRRFGTEFMDAITIGTYRFLSAYFENGRDISNQTPSSLQGFLPKVEQVISGWT